MNIEITVYRHVSRESALTRSRVAGRWQSPVWWRASARADGATTSGIGPTPWRAIAVAISLLPGHDAYGHLAIAVPPSGRRRRAARVVRMATAAKKPKQQEFQYAPPKRPRG